MFHNIISPNRQVCRAVIVERRPQALKPSQTIFTAVNDLIRTASGASAYYNNTASVSAHLKQSNMNKTPQADAMKPVQRARSVVVEARFQQVINTHHKVDIRI